MKTTYTHLEITRLAYNEPPQNHQKGSVRSAAEKEYALLKNMQKKVDNCLVQPSQSSVDAILLALKSF